MYRLHLLHLAKKKKKNGLGQRRLMTLPPGKPKRVPPRLRWKLPVKLRRLSLRNKKKRPRSKRRSSRRSRQRVSRHREGGLQLPMPESGRRNRDRHSPHNTPRDRVTPKASTPGEDRVTLDRLFNEIQSSISLRPEFSYVQASDVRRASRILAKNGMLSISDLRATPKRNRDFLIEGLRKAGAFIRN